MFPAAAIPLAFLPGVSDLVSGPREWLFRQLGSEDGSGPGLVQALLGAERGGDLANYGGLAADMILDPMNLVMAGGMAGVGAAARAGRASRIAAAEGELAAASRMVQAADDAAASVPLQYPAGPGNLPVGSRTALLPEVAVPPDRKIRVADLPSTPEMTPEISYRTIEARRLQDRAQNNARFAPGSDRPMSEKRAKIDPGRVDAEMTAIISKNRAANAAAREAEWAALGREPVTGWDVMGGDGGLLEDILASDRLQRLMPGMSFPSRMGGIAPDVLAAIRADLAAAQAAPGSSGALTAALMGGGAFTGYLGGDRFLNT